MSGVNEYFNGRFVSKDAKDIVWLVVVATLTFVGGFYITYYAAYTEEENSPTRIQSLFVLVAYINSVITHGVILIEGVLERNIIQIVLSSVFNLFTFGFLVADIAVYLERAIEYIYIGFASANILFNLYIFWWVYTLRKEFGWFYYKSYGSSWENTVVCTIRKTQSVLMRLLVQDILSFWLFRETVYDFVTLHYASTALFYVMLVLYIIEGTVESYLLRTINIGISGTMFGHAIYLLVISTSAEIDDVTEAVPLKISLGFLSDTCVRIVILLMYTGVLIADLYSFGKGYRGYYKIRQKKRMCIK